MRRCASRSATVEAFLHLSGLIVDDRGTIQMMAGTGCAFDTLLTLILTVRLTRVVSRCPATRKVIGLTIISERIEDLGLKSTLLLLCLPDSEAGAGDVQETICARGHFFVDCERTSI